MNPVTLFGLGLGYLAARNSMGAENIANEVKGLRAELAAEREKIEQREMAEIRRQQYTPEPEEQLSYRDHKLRIASERLQSIGISKKPEEITSEQASIILYSKNPLLIKLFGHEYTLNPQTQKELDQGPESWVGPSHGVYPLARKQRAAAKRLQMAGINKNPKELTLPEANLLLSREPLRISFNGQTYKLKPLSSSEQEDLLASAGDQRADWYSGESAAQLVSRLLD